MFSIWYWLVIGAGMLLSGWAAMRVRSTFTHYSQIPTRRGITGAMIAEQILRDNDIHDVRVEAVAGQLSDHYDPTAKVLRLSEPVYGEASIAAFGVAAHEVGHAIQHAQGYAPLKFRSAWVPVANLGGGISVLVLIGAVLLGGMATAMGSTAALLGIVLFATTTVFTLITLPVEFDASRRALLTLERGGYVTSEELEGARKVLNAAAMTYVAAFLTSLMQLIYWAYALGLFGRRSED
ncbi:MAG: zinc metallopeptidase [Planctomycetes bacterium]|nr:zinc metallopeptidase [Planctomycetota bacterium]MCB9871841.1 zinc metallopeptidase [Planctomycetota bacterium]